MYGSVVRSDSQYESDDDAADSIETPLGSPVSVETAAAAARRRSANAFIPVVCSLFGVIIFMRLGLIVGVVGLLRAWAVIFVAFGITFLSIGSLSALASSKKRGGGENRQIDSNGFYDAVLRSGGEHAGRAIGGLLFLAFNIASAYYLLGFAEITAFYLGVTLKHYALPWNDDGSWITVLIASSMLAALTVAAIVFGRIQKRLLVVVLVVVLLAIACNVLFLVVHNSSTATGASTLFLRGNLKGHAPELLSKMFGEFFPAFCGVLAGAHLADKLVINPSKATSAEAPRSSVHLIVGAHKALVFSCVVYSVLSLVLATCVENGNLRKERFVVQLVVDSILGVPVIYLGITATTLTSALSNIMGAASMYEWIRSPPQPKVETNQPVLHIRVVSNNSSPFSAVRGPMLAWVVSQTAIACGSVDTIIPIVSSTFLFTFAVVNFTCFYHEIMSPSFSSSFTMYSKWSALVGFCLSIGALFLVMSTFFVGCMVAGMVGAFILFQHKVPEFVGSIRQDTNEVETRGAALVSGMMSPYAEVSESPRFSEVMLPPIDTEIHSDEDRAKRIQMAALYVRDALHGRFLGEEYVSEGLHKLQYKRWYHALQFARMSNMAILLGLSFFEVPSWCFFSLQCGDLKHVLMWDLPTLPREVTLVVELLNLAILGIESALKFQYLGKRLYFANKWHIVQMILLLSDATSVVLVACWLVPQERSASSDSSDQFKPIVPSPIIRPLLLLTMSERLRSGFLSLLRVVPRVMDGLLTILVLIVIYSIAGMVMFEGTKEGRQYFPDFGSAWLNMLILLTTANYPDVMMPAYEHARYTSLFFITFLLIGLLLMMNLVFASIYQNYRQEVSHRTLRFAKRRKQSLEFAFQLLPSDSLDIIGDSKPVKTISRDTLEALIAELLRPVVSFFDATTRTPPERSYDQIREAVGKKNELTFIKFVSKIKGFAARQKVKAKTNPPVHRRRSSSRPVEAVAEFVRSPGFEYFVDVIILGNLVAILFEIQAKIDQQNEAYARWEVYMPLFSCFYLVEMAFKMYANPWRSYFESFKNRYDCVVTIVIVVAEVSIQVHYSAGMNWQWIRVLLLLRFLRCLRLLVALQSLSTMFSIVLQLLPTFTTLYGMLGIVMMEYAAIGVQIFGGKLRIGDARLGESTFAKSNYFANNFNDFPSALTTLFELLLVNNWNVIMEGTELVTSKWSRIYFISFYVIAVIMMLNLVIAFVVEAYFEQAGALDSDDPSASTQLRKDRNSLSALSSSAVDSPTPGAPTLDSPCSVSTDDDRFRQLLLRRRSQVASRSRGDGVNIDEGLTNRLEGVSQQEALTPMASLPQRHRRALFVVIAAIAAFGIAAEAAEETQAQQRAAEESEPTYLRVIVVGATGDLAAKYLWVACFRLALEARLLHGQHVLFTAAARDSQDDGDRWKSRFFTTDWAARVCGRENSEESNTCRRFYTTQFVPKIQYTTLETRDDYETLSRTFGRQDSELSEEGRTERGRLVYLAIPPRAFLQTSQHLSTFLRPTRSNAFFRVVIEKPFGRDLGSAESLALGLRKVLLDDEMLLMDHYAGKLGLRVIDSFVRSNAKALARLWNGKFIQNIEILMSETETCEHRLDYFDSGIIRDVMANHLQLLLGAVVSPSLQHCDMPTLSRTFSGDDILTALCPHEMTRFLQSLRPLGPVLVGQYEGYNPGVSNRSVTATAAVTHIESIRTDWAATTFSISAAKATHKRLASVRVTFKLDPSMSDNCTPCSIDFTIQSGVGSSGERIKVKCAGLGVLTAPPSWSAAAPGEFVPSTVLHTQASPLPWHLGDPISAYDSLLHDAAHGRFDSFMKIEEVLASWELWSPIVRAAEKVPRESIVVYPVGATAWRQFDAWGGNTCPLTTPWALESHCRKDAADTEQGARGT